jgi:hypothetical protein
MLEITYLHNGEELIAGDVYDSRISGFKHLLRDSSQAKIVKDAWPVVNRFGFVPEFVDLLDQMIAESNEQDGGDA